MDYEISCGPAVFQKPLIRFVPDSPRRLENRFVDGRLPLATRAPSEGAWQSALAQAMVESEFLPIKAISLCIVATVEHTCFDGGRTMHASGLDAELEEPLVLPICREVASAFRSASLFLFTRAQ